MRREGEFRLTGVLNFQGSKGNGIVSFDNSCFTINHMHGSDVHVVFGKRKKSASNKLGTQKVIAVLDRCGNNWKNGKGGCGILLHEEYAPCCATMFQPFVLIQRKKEKDYATRREY